MLLYTTIQYAIGIPLWILFMLIVPYNTWYAIFNNGELPIVEYIKEKILSYKLNNYRNNKSNNRDTNTSNKTD